MAKTLKKQEQKKTPFEEWASHSPTHRGGGTAYRTLASVVPGAPSPDELLAMDPQRLTSRLVRKGRTAPRSAKWYFARLRRAYAAYQAADRDGKTPKQPGDFPPPPALPSEIAPPAHNEEPPEPVDHITIRGNLSVKDVEAMIQNGWRLVELTFTRTK